MESGALNLLTNFDGVLTDDLIVYGVIAYLIAYTSWEMYLVYRQLRVYKETVKMPEMLNSKFSEAVFQRSRSYAIDMAEFRICTNVYMNYLTMLSIYDKSLCSGWTSAVNTAKSLGLPWDNVYAVNLCFTVFNCVSAMNAALPFAIYYTFVIEQKYGFNNQGLISFLIDHAKDTVAITIASVVYASAIIFFIHYDEKRFYFWLWLISFSMIIAEELISASIVGPLFNEFTPLPEGRLRTSIEQLAGSMNFPLSQVCLIDASTRSDHAGAYLTGFVGEKRIVLYDTLLNGAADQLPYEDEEILAIVCHELGHWKHGHIFNIMMLSQITEFFRFFILNLLLRYSPFYQAFGCAKGNEPVMIGFIVIQAYILAPYDLITQFLFTNYTRYCEVQADAFAAKMNYRQQLKNALLKTKYNNLTFPVEDWLYSLWFLDHPTLVERIKLIDEIKDD